MSLVATLAVLALLLAAGRGLAQLLGRRFAETDLAGVAHAALGLLTLHLGAYLLQLLGIPWSLVSLGAPLLALAVVPLLLLRRLPHRGPASSTPRRQDPTRRRHRPGWGELLALAAVLVAGWAAVSLWSTNPDFVYHWGPKGHRDLLARGLDVDYLTRPWNEQVHPDYPHLLPILFALTALAAGGWSEPGLLLWSPLFLAGSLLAARAALLRAGVSGLGRQGTLAVIALGASMFEVSHRLAGGPDGLLSLALLGSASVLLAGRGEGPADAATTGRDDLQVGLFAALATAAKLEGVVLAGLLVAARALGSGLGRRPLSRRWAALALPAALTTAPWIALNLRFGLFGQPNSGPFDPDNAPLVLGALGQALRSPTWHGLALAALVASPVLLAVGRVRPLVAVCLALVGFYVYAYFTARSGADFWVLSSFPRLLVHVVPALLLAAGVALDRWAGPRPATCCDKL